MNKHQLFYSKGLCGLTNLDNTCYMNSIIQCLNNQYEFLIDIYKEYNDNENILNSFISLSKSIYKKNGIIQPSDFLSKVHKSALINNNMEFIGNGQKCAADFLTFLLDVLSEINKQEINIKIKVNLDRFDINNINSRKIHIGALKVYKTFFKKNYSTVVKHFYGQYINILRNNKDEISYQYDPYNIIALPINNNNNNIYDCLDDFCAIEKLNDSNFRLVKFYSFPKILIIQFKRNVLFNKNKKLIKFPHNLDMSKYYIGRLSQKFELVSVCNHFGTNKFGHYTTYAKNYNNNWYEFDDNNVYSASPNNVITKNAYILFYKLLEQ